MNLPTFIPPPRPARYAGKPVDADALRTEAMLALAAGDLVSVGPSGFLHPRLVFPGSENPLVYRLLCSSYGFINSRERVAGQEFCPDCLEIIAGKRGPLTRDLVPLGRLL